MRGTTSNIHQKYTLGGLFKRYVPCKGYKSTIENKYVAFCDILGFSSLVLNDFHEILKIYKEFKADLEKASYYEAEISIYSDSVLIVGNDLIKVAKTAQLLLWTLLRYGWIARGGLAYGTHWKESDDRNLFIVSEALVKAVAIEKNVKSPVIAISEEISIGLEYWIHGFFHPVFDLPIIHYDNKNIINPFNKYWFKSAEIILENKRNLYNDHSEKYEYLLNMIDAVKKNREFIPMAIMNDLIERGLVGKKPGY